MTNKLLHQARHDAHVWFEGELDKGKKPYVLHLERVAEFVRPLGEEFEIVALLHDSIEDGKTTWDQLVREYGIRIANAVGVLTRQEGMTYADYIEAVATSENELAIRVKIADLIDNLRDVGNPDFERLHQRYVRALRRLLFGLSY